MVETINRLMLFATGKHSLWDKNKTPPWEPDGTPTPRDPRYWFLVVPVALGFAFAWAVVGLTYLMPPFQVYHGLLNFSLYRGEVIFLSAATTVLTLEFLFARHLFCRYGCAVGIFQSFAWMVNKKAMVVGFERKRLTDCADCLERPRQRLRRGVPDAPQAAQRQALDVRLHAVRPVHFGLRHGQPRQPARAFAALGQQRGRQKQRSRFLRALPG